MKTPTNREMIEQNAQSIGRLSIALYAVLAFLVLLTVATIVGFQTMWFVFGL